MSFPLGRRSGETGLLTALTPRPTPAIDCGTTTEPTPMDTQSTPVRHGFRSLRTRMILWVLLASGAVLLAAVSLSSRLSRDTAVRAAEQEAFNAADAARNRVLMGLSSVEQSTSCWERRWKPFNRRRWLSMDCCVGSLLEIRMCHSSTSLSNPLLSTLAPTLRALLLPILRITLGSSRGTWRQRLIATGNGIGIAFH